ncbi:lysophospholipid acyltransferase family protein [Actinokineospora pegani]|uniref:lysophospholipid acyltransferase family protein n=1 Tax=Actinokineospora pegani TaxID=2654637 RepID=UPI0012EAEC73|nr:lysophospholipid acyltransferase family protein [Actinokineospora pegani]
MTPGPDLPIDAKPWLHEVGRVLARTVHRPGHRVRWHHRDRVPATGPVVLVANHSSLVEPQLLFGGLPRRAVFLVKSELFHGPLGWALRGLGQIPVRRGTPDRAPLMAAVQVLRNGGLVGVFPEGTRGAGDVAAAEQGAAWLVRTSGARVLPVATRGTRRPPGAAWRLRPVVDLVVGEPFDPRVGPGRAGLATATETIRARLAELVRDLDERRRPSSPQNKAAP